jgi:hypothetical protein
MNCSEGAWAQLYRKHVCLSQTFTSAGFQTNTRVRIYGSRVSKKACPIWQPVC